MHYFLLGFILFMVATDLFSAYLLRRQLNYVRRHQDQVPPDFVGKISLAEHRRAADYTVTRGKFKEVSTVFGLIVSMGMLLWGIDRIDGGISAWLSPDSQPVLHAIALVVLVSLVGQITDLPLDLYSTFGIEQKFGFNKTSVRTYALDMARGLLVSAVISLPLMAGAFWVMNRYHGMWWLYVWVGLAAIMFVGPRLYFGLIMPLYNKITPVADPELKMRITALVERSGFGISGVFLIDASKRSGHGNAFIIGFGKSKRIFLYDTLVNSHPVDEIVAVIAHEFGHAHHKHIMFGMIRGMAMSFVMLAAVGWLVQQPWLTVAFGFHNHDMGISVMAALLLLSTVNVILNPVMNWLSCRHEYQADAFAGRQTGPAHMTAALLRLTIDNAQTLTSDPLFVMFNYDHPPVPARISQLNQLAMAS